MKSRQPQAAPSKKALKPSAEAPSPAEVKRKKGLGAEIRAIRDRLGITQLELANKLATSRGRLAAWEAGEKPPPQMTARLASLALPGVRNSFIEYAGFDPKGLEEQFWALFLSGRECAGDIGAVQISLVECEAQKKTVIRHGARRVTFPLPNTRVPFPDRTICVKLPEGFSGTAWGAGDLLIVDTDKTDPQHLLGCLVAAYFSAEVLNFPQLPLGTPITRGTFVSQKELESMRKYNPGSNVPAMSEAEFMKKYGLRPGVRLGWIRIENLPEHYLPLKAWRVVLEKPVIAGLSQSWEDRTPLGVSNWVDGEFLGGESLLPFVREGVRVEGRVIGWLSSQQPGTTKHTDIEEQK
jgi:DNA-binding transcriptional regulator YiaG